MAEWQNGGMAEWRNGGMAEWRVGRMAEWQNVGREGGETWWNGGMAEWRKGGMAAWNVGNEVGDAWRDFMMKCTIHIIRLYIIKYKNRYKIFAMYLAKPLSACRVYSYSCVLRGI